MGKLYSFSCLPRNFLSDQFLNNDVFFDYSGFWFALTEYNKGVKVES